MPPHVVDWLNLIFRWAHVTIGIAWIGSSFYFNWLENSLNRDDPREGIEGSLWAVHGGGFYFVEKLDVAPDEMPDKLHWFMYEAYFTWVTGICLLAIVYYLRPDAFLLGANPAGIGAWTGIGIGVVSLILAWLVYDLLCRSPLGENNVVLTVLGFIIMTAAAWGFTQVFNPRAAYIHVGAMIGTMMAGNVFFVIIPAHQELVDAVEEGREPDAAVGEHAAMRSLHNNYLTLPILYIMISNHFSSTWGHEYNWVILAGLALTGAAVRHWFNLRGRGDLNVWILPAAAIGIAALGIVTSPNLKIGEPAPAYVDHEPVSYKKAEAIIANRCVQCHSENPSDDIFAVAPAGVKFDTPEQIKQYADRIMIRAVEQKNMPFNNKTNMTRKERTILGAWIHQGAKLDE